MVQQAVANLYKVGSETVDESSDLLLKRDMPPALEMVQAASDSLGQAAQFIAADPYSVQGWCYNEIVRTCLRAHITKHKSITRNRT